MTIKNNLISYCGIVYKNIPEEHQYMMEAIGFLLANKRTILRTCGDLGVLNPFEIGANTNKGIIEKISFNEVSVQTISYCNKFFNGKFSDFSENKQKYIANIVGSILGKNINDFVKFVIVYGDNKTITSDIKKICNKHSINFYDISTNSGYLEIQDKIDFLVKRYVNQETINF